MTLRDLVDGAVTSARTPDLRMLMFLSLAMFTAISIFFSLEPLYVKDTVRLDQQAVSFLWSAQAAGSLIGALVLARTREGQGRELRYIGLALGIAGAGALVYAGFPALITALIGGAIMGYGFSRFFPPSLALIQRVSGEEKVGRVTSVFSVLQESIGMVAALAFASLALPASAVQPMLLGVGVFMAVAGAAALFTMRRHRERA